MPLRPINDTLCDLLKNVDRPGNFYATGKLEIFPPSLEVAGVGRIALPLLAAQAEQLVAAATQAPYGRGQETIVDPLVRRTWQINADQITLGGKHWQADLDGIVKRCTAGLGVTGAVKAELYKLLVYGEGDFFVGHRDTEKTPGMFATLVLVLPSLYQGGELLVAHQGQQVTLDLRCNDDTSEIAFAAFYADCLHEVRPITQGSRLTLIYNLAYADKKLPLPQPPDYQPEQDRVAELLRDWTRQLASNNTDNADNAPKAPEKLIYLLEHAYTEAELGFDALKNADKALVDVLLGAANKADCDIHLALVSIEESGYAEYDRYGDYEIGEVTDSRESVATWRRPDGQPCALPSLPLHKEECCPLGVLDDIDSDDVSFTEATGNEGASFERSYRHAAVVLWPRTHTLAVWNQAGIEASLTLLRDLHTRWTQSTESGADAQTALWQDAHRLAGYILRDWSSRLLPATVYHRENGHLQTFVDTMTALRDTVQLERLWTQVAAQGLCQRASSIALLPSLPLLPLADVARWTQEAITHSSTATTDAEACAALLAGVCATVADGAPPHDNLVAAAHALYAILPGDPQRAAPAGAQVPHWQRHVPATVHLVVDAMGAFSAIDAKLANTALDYLRDWPKVYGMDETLLPAALQLHAAQRSRDTSAVLQLTAWVQEHLHARVALPLEPPADWRRDDPNTCTCADCAQLHRFLDNPTEARWAFKAAEQRRKHVEQNIKTHKLDVDHVTNHSSRPYQLVCTKNQNSYLRRVAQRKSDLDALEQLSQA